MAAQIALVKSVGQSAQAAAAASAKKAAASGRSAKQIAASKKWAAAGRAAQKGKPRSAKQIAAAKRNLAKGRAVVKARTAERNKTATAPASREDTLISLHQMPVCAAVAVAGSLGETVPGITFSDADILALSKSTGPVPVGELLEHVRHAGFLGYRLKDFWQCDPDLVIPGLVCCYQETSGYHAVLAVPGGMRSWGTVRSWPKQPEEAWYLDWELT